MTLPTISDPGLARQMLAAARNYTPLTPEELAQVHQLARRQPVWFH